MPWSEPAYRGALFGRVGVMLQALASNGVAILVADGEVGASIMPNGRYLVAPVGSLVVQSDWEPYDGPMPDVPQAALDEIAALKRQGQP